MTDDKVPHLLAALEASVLRAKVDRQADEIERLRAENGMLREELAETQDLYVLRRRKHNEAAREVARLRAVIAQAVAENARLRANYVALTGALDERRNVGRTDREHLDSWMAEIDPLIDAASAAHTPATEESPC